MANDAASDEPPSSARWGLVSRVLVQWLPVIAWLIVAASVVLMSLAETRMGVYRDVSVRNPILTEGIFAADRLHAYTWSGVALLFAGSLYAAASWRSLGALREAAVRGPYRRAQAYVVSAPAWTALWLGALAYSKSAPWLAYPWMLLAVTVMLAAQYMRLVYLFFRMMRR